MILRIDGQPEAGAEDAAAGEAVTAGDKGLPLGANFEIPPSQRTS
jgi:hypothetical protein